MAKFLNPDKLVKEIEDLFEEAEELIFIVSPFIKLDRELKLILQTKKDNSNFQVVLLYGKNEMNHNQSLGSDDLSFFKEFKNVEIFYHPDLHAKYYANELKSIVTSLNLHAYSIANNIEVGVLFERRGRFSGNGDNREDDKSFKFFENVIENSQCIFSQHSEQKRSFFGLIKGDVQTVVEVDETFKTHSSSSVASKNYSTQSKISHTGFCIRTGVEIPFDVNRPLSKKGYDSWVQFENHDYPEAYCHFSGEKSFGKTSFARPVLNSHFKIAMDLQYKLHERGKNRR